MLKYRLLCALLVSGLVCAEKVEIRLVHTTDLHGHVLPVTDYEGNTNVGGLLQLATLIEAQRELDPDLLLIDNGDTFQGSPVSSMFGGRPIVDVLNALEFDVWNIGNHEFDWGVDVLGRNLNAFSGTVLSANCHWDGPAPSPYSAVQPYVIRDVKGVRLALIGLTHPKIPFWSRNMLLKDTIIEQPLNAMFRVMPRVRAEKPDIIVVIAHMGAYDEGAGLEEPLQEVLEHFHDIDIVIGGHTHTAVPSVKFGDTYYTQAAYHGIALGEMRLTYDTERKRLRDVRGVIEPAGPATEQSAMVRAQLADELAVSARMRTQELCMIEGVLGERVPRSGESAQQTLICEAIADALDADVVFHNAFGAGNMVSNRTFTGADLYALVPYENHIVYADLSAAQLRAVLDDLAEFWGGHRFAFPFGLRAVIDLEGLSGERVASLMDTDNEPLGFTNRYRAAFNSYMAASGGNRHPFLRAMLARSEVNTIDGEMTSREAVANYLRAQQTYTPHVVRSVDIVERAPGLFSPIGTNEPVTAGDVRLVEVNAVQYGTPVAGAQSEWFAVHNNGTDTVDLQGFRFSDADEGGEFEIEKQLLLEPGEQIVFCRSLEGFSRLPYTGDPYRRLFEYGPLAERMVLGDGGDELIVVAADGQVSDMIVYGDNRGYWPAVSTNMYAPWHPAGTSLKWTGENWIVNEEPLGKR